ncbi:MAG: DUF2157 domain-containing protein [Deltaproteobacteria bacterium]|nr:DUF2157 domain-containing protein [Deltaproteobacteria bacterium]
MNKNRFLKQLKKELPGWMEQGWVRPGADQAILEQVGQRAESASFLSVAFAILGVLLLGSGVITFFAANWGVMPKIVKLGLLLGGLWLAFAVAGYLLRDDRAPHLGQAAVLLGVILFGANIMLIAQIYHIDSHYPNGVLLWSLGGLAVAWLLRSQPALIAAIALAVLWTGMESFGFQRQMHGWFLPLWLAFLPLIYRMRWKPALHVAMIGLLLWSFFCFESLRSPLFVVQVYFLAYLALFLLGLIMDSYERWSYFAVPVQRYSLVAALVSFYALTFPHLQFGYLFLHGTNIRPGVATAWLAATSILLVLVAVLVLWHRQRFRGQKNPLWLLWGQALVAAGIVLITVNLFIGVRYANLMAIGFNLLMFAGVVWLILAGSHLGDRFFVNTAFFFFALTVMSRYFDTFWSLMNRSFFFMAGGVLLIGGGIFLERKRRKLTRQITSRRGEGGGL